MALLAVVGFAAPLHGQAAPPPVNLPPPPRGPNLGGGPDQLGRERHAANAALALIRDYRALPMLDVLDEPELLIGVGNEALWDTPERIAGRPPEGVASR